MERLELAISGVEQVLRPGPPEALPAQAVARGRPAVGGAAATAELSMWLDTLRQQLPRLTEALGAEDTSVGDFGHTARSRQLSRERSRLLRRLRQLTPPLVESSTPTGQDEEALRVALLRLLGDISHHHQRVNDLVYDAGWRDVGGSE
jgi:hypothetical protein